MGCSPFSWQAKGDEQIAKGIPHSLAAASDDGVTISVGRRNRGLQFPSSTQRYSAQEETCGGSPGWKRGVAAIGDAAAAAAAADDDDDPLLVEEELTAPAAFDDDDDDDDDDEKKDASIPTFSLLLVGVSSLLSVYCGLVEKRRQGGKGSGRGI